MRVYHLQVVQGRRGIVVDSLTLSHPSPPTSPNEESERGKSTRDSLDSPPLPSLSLSLIVDHQAILSPTPRPSCVSIMDEGGEGARIRLKGGGAITPHTHTGDVGRGRMARLT